MSVVPGWLDPMSEDQHTTGPGESLDSPDLVLAALHASHHVVNQAEIDKLHLAIRWAIMHPVESIDQAPPPSTAPRVSSRSPDPVHPWSRSSASPTSRSRWACPATPAAPTSATPSSCATGSRSSGRSPRPVGCRCGRRGGSRRPPSRCAQTAAAYVDTHLAHVARRCSFAQIDRAVDDALRRYDPAEAEKRRRQAADARHFDVDLQQVSFDGTVHVDADLDLADALDLNDAITAGAAPARRTWAATESLDVRRSLAAGALARRELTLDLQPTDPAEQPAPRKRELMIYVHLVRRSPSPASRTPGPASPSSRSRNGAPAPTPTSPSGR